MKITKKLSAIVLLSAVSSFSSLSTNAHEPRIGVSGAFNITVGQRTEPAYANQANKFDLIISNLDGTPATVSEITLDVDVLFLKDDNFDAKIVKRARMTHELVRDPATPHRFNINYLPTTPGAYGFELSGTINGVHINEKYVCEGGSKHPEGKSFGCVEVLQAFPGGKQCATK